MPISVTHALKCVRLQVINRGFEMPICVTHAFKCVRLQVINTGFEMPIYITYVVDCVIVNMISSEMLIPYIQYSWKVLEQDKKSCFCQFIVSFIKKLFTYLQQFCTFNVAS